MTYNRNRTRTLLLKSVMILLGATLSSIGLEIFLIPNNIIDGGIVGISIMSSYLTHFPLGIFTFCLNVPFLIMGYRQIGKTFVLSTLFAIICLSVGVSLLHPISGLTHDVFLAAIFGAGVGLIIRAGGSLDGTEMIAIIFDKKISFSIGEIVMFFNVFILGAAGFLYGWDRAMYSLVTYFIAFKVIDIVVEGFDSSKGVMIVSDCYSDIAAALTDRLGRGVTLLEGQGGYSRLETTVIYVVVSRLEITKLKSIVLGFDSDALITIGTVEVAGKKYRKKAIH